MAPGRLFCFAQDPLSQCHGPATRHSGSIRQARRVTRPPLSITCRLHPKSHHAIRAHTRCLIRLDDIYCLIIFNNIILCHNFKNRLFDVIVYIFHLSMPLPGPQLSASQPRLQPQPSLRAPPASTQVCVGCICSHKL
jgi:hypothetical protein